MKQYLMAVVLVVGLVPPVYATLVEISLRETAYVHDNPVKLRDIAELRGPNHQHISKLGGLAVGPLPGKEQEMRITQRYLTLLIRKRFPRARYEWSSLGADEVLVRSQGHRRSLAEKARDYLRQRLAKRYPDIGTWHIKSVNRIAEIDGNFDVSYRIDANTPLRPRMCVWIDFRRNGETYRTTPVWFAVKAMRDVYVVRKNLYPRATIKAGQLAREYRNVAAQAGELVSADANIDKFWVRRLLPVGHVLVKTDLVAVPIIKAKQNVHIVVASGKVRIQATGIALADGYIGEQIFVAKSHGGERFQATIAGPGLVKVE